MRHNTTARILLFSFVFALALLAAGTAYAGPTIITEADDPHIERMLDLILLQNFDETDTSAAAAKEKIAHFIHTSNFKAVGGGIFPYPNSSGRNFTSIEDGFYKKTIKGARGCMAYARFVSRVIYDTEGPEKHKALYGAEAFKTMLQTYGQAGDHLRADGRHSLIFISGDDVGFYTLDYINMKNQNMQLAYWRYADFLDFKLYKGRQLFLFDANPSVNVLADIADASAQSPATDSESASSD